MLSCYVWKLLCCYKMVGAVQPGEENSFGRPYSSLPVHEGGLQESWRGTFLQGHVAIGQSVMASSWKKVDLTLMKEINSLLWGVGTGCLEKMWIPLSLEVFRARLDGALSNLSSGSVPACGRGLETRCSVRSLPTQTILWFYEMSLKADTKDWRWVSYARESTSDGAESLIPVTSTVWLVSPMFGE